MNGLTSTYVNTRKNNDILRNDELEHVWLGEMKVTKGCGGVIRLRVVLNDYIERRNHSAILTNQVLHVRVDGGRHIIETTDNKF